MKKYKPKWENQVSRCYTEPELRMIADEMLEWISTNEGEKSSNNFWLNDFAAGKMITPARLKSFALVSDYFRAVFEICKAIQESKLLKMALYKEVNATSAVFILKSVIGTGENDEPADLDTAKKQVEEMFE